MDKNRLVINLLEAGFELVKCSDINNLVFEKKLDTEHFVCKKTVTMNMTSGVLACCKHVDGIHQPDSDICANISEIACSESGEVLTDIIRGKEFVL